MQIATWNVNSLKVRLPHVLDWFANHGLRCFGTSGVKMDNAANAKLVAEFAAIGYNYVYNGQNL